MGENGNSSHMEHVNVVAAYKVLFLNNIAKWMSSSYKLHMYVCVFIPACIVMVFVLVSKHVNCCVTLYCSSLLYMCGREVGAVQPKRWRRVLFLCVCVCLCVLGCGRANMLFIIICSCCYFSCCCYCLCPRWQPSVGVAVATVLVVVVVVVDYVVIFIALRYCCFAMFDCCCCYCCLCVFSTNT